MNDILGVDNGIYMDLDSLFDTRLSTIKSYDKKIYDRLFINEYYDKRLTEEFSYLNIYIFKTLFSKRNNDILHGSKITEVLTSFIKEADLLLTKRLESSTSPIIEVVINSYPYTLTESEENQIINAINHFSNINTLDISIIRVNPYDITLKEVGTRYTTMFMYNALAWLDYQIAVDSGEASATTLYGPGLLVNPILFSKDNDVDMMFKYQTELFGRYIHYVPLPIKVFNIKKVYRETNTNTE